MAHDKFILVDSASPGPVVDSSLQETTTEITSSKPIEAPSFIGTIFDFERLYTKSLEIVLTGVGPTGVDLNSVCNGYSTNGEFVSGLTLANGDDFQLKIIYINSLYDKSRVVLTPANFRTYTDILFSSSREYAMLLYVGTEWVCLFTNATLRT